MVGIKRYFDSGVLLSYDYFPFDSKMKLDDIMKIIHQNKYSIVEIYRFPMPIFDFELYWGKIKNKSRRRLHAIVMEASYVEEGTYCLSFLKEIGKEKYDNSINELFEYFYEHRNTYNCDSRYAEVLGEAVRLILEGREQEDISKIVNKKISQIERDEYDEEHEEDL